MRKVRTSLSPSGPPAASSPPPDADVPRRRVAVDESRVVDPREVPAHVADGRLGQRLPEVRLADVLEDDPGLLGVHVADHRRRDAVAARLARQPRLLTRSLDPQAFVQRGMAVGPGLSLFDDAVPLESDGGLGALEFGRVVVDPAGRPAVAPPADVHQVRPEVRIDARLLDSDGVARGEHLGPEDGDHSGVVLEELRRRGVEVGTALVAHLGQHRPQAVVLGDAAAEHEFLAVGQRGARPRLR